MEIKSFYYPAFSGVEFSEDEYLPKEFSSLKRNILRHIASSKSHTEVVMEIKAKEKADRELKSKNLLAGINLGRICMKNYILGRPDTDYENDVLIVKKAGSVVG